MAGKTAHSRYTRRAVVELLLWILLAFVVLTAIGGLIAFRVSVKWSREAIELRDFGRETTGRVVEKRRERRRGNWSTWIRYEYVDAVGKTHRSRRNLVTPEAWDAHDEGGPIAVIYSQKRPHVSLPKYLLDLAPRR